MFDNTTFMASRYKRVNIAQHKLTQIQLCCGKIQAYFPDKTSYVPVPN